ncbi:MAG: carbon-nitrogen hydrolase family protein [Deltaproteobacteria bacterium]
MENETGKFTAAAVQTAPVFLNKAETVGKIVSLIEEAAAGGASLIVFPEAIIPAYPYWPKDLGSIEGRKLVLDAYTELYKNSVEIPDEDTDKLCRAAAKAGAYVVLGVNEREGGTLYNTILYIDKNGTMLGKHRKLMSIDSEKCIWGMGGEEDLNVFDTEVGKIGGFFCYEHHMTLAKYAMYQKGEQIHAGLWAGHGFVKPTMDFASRQYAFEGQVFVIASSGHITDKMIPDSFPLKKQTLWDYPGGSGIINPRGDYLAGPVYGKEEIIYADIDRDMIIRAKAVIDGAGHFSRPDILRLDIGGYKNGKDQYTDSEHEIQGLRNKVEELSARQRELHEKLDSIAAKLSGREK